MDDATRLVVAHVNRVHGLAFVRHARCASGLQDGAWRLTDEQGRSAILKWRADPADGYLRRLPAIRALRAAGYPTPEWLAAGRTAAGWSYYVQDFVDGEPAHPLTLAAADLLLGVLARHHGLGSGHADDRNEHIRRLALDESSGSRRHTVRALGPPGDELVERFDHLLDRYRPVTLPTGDLVHGDFNTCNVLIRAGQVSAVIDIDAHGRGTRGFDYACLLRESYVEGYGPAVRQRLRQAGQAAVGPAVLALCAAATAFDIVDFKLRHDPANIGRTMARLAQLAVEL